VKLLLKIVSLLGGIACVLVLTFVFWGEQIDTAFSQEACVRLFAESRGFAWLIGVGLLIVDLLLPIPASSVISALGSVYGVVLGGLIGVMGMVLSGFIGFFLARSIGTKVLSYLATETELQRFRSFFERWGSGAIVVSRSVPVLSETIAILAGFSGMPVLLFLLSLVLGAIPASFLFAYVGYAMRDIPQYAMLLSAVIPLVIWFFIGFKGRFFSEKKT
jgi:uncharacterized membrane protein YdjX (TVP38/TMEM64 family)